MSHKLLLLTRENDKYLTLLHQRSLPELTIVDEQPQHIAHTDIWLAEPGLAAPLVSLASSLQWIQSTFAGVDKLTQLKRPLSCQLTNIKEVFGPLMSEYVFGYLLSIFRQQSLYAAQQAERKWQEGHYCTLRGKILLVMGTGSIGSHLANTAQHFGMKVIGISKSGSAHARFDEVYDTTQLHEQLSKADVVVNALPHTPETIGLLSHQALMQLKADAILFNVGRGSIVNLTQLTHFLTTRPDVTAILDVFEQEPLSSDEPIWQLPNAIITPHIAAPSFPEQVVEIFAANYHRYLNKQPLRHQVNLSLGY